MIEYRLINGGLGQKANIYSLINRGEEAYSEYISNLQDKDKNKFVSLFKFIKQVGVIKNKQKYEIIKGTDVVELKIHGYRILAHKIQTKAKYKYIILLGFKKPKKSIQQREIKLAKQLSSKIIAGNAIEQQRGSSG